MPFHWFLPTAGDSHDIVSGGQASLAADTSRPPDIGYLALVARAAEWAGFEAVLTPTGTFCEDAWLTTAALLGETERLKFLVAFRPGLISPTLAAQMAATYQRISGGRPPWRGCARHPVWRPPRPAARPRSDRCRRAGRRPAARPPTNRRRRPAEPGRAVPARWRSRRHSARRGR